MVISKSWSYIMGKYKGNYEAGKLISINVIEGKSLNSKDYQNKLLITLHHMLITVNYLTHEEAIALVNYTYNRDSGDVNLVEEADSSVGAFKDQDAALRFIALNIVDMFRPVAIYLFGSRARGDYRNDSDFDILLVHRDSEDLDVTPLRMIIGRSGVSVDFVMCTEAEFSEFRDNKSTIIGQAFEINKCLYKESVKSRQKKDALVKE
jgi:uncharacterized protein